MPLVAVVGPGAQDARPVDLENAFEVGRRLPGQGFAVLTGGLDGVMAQTAHGAREAGGVVVGLLPGADPSAGNEHLTIALPTGLGQLRNGLLVMAADAVVAVGCSWGTLSEIALAQRTGKPLVCVGAWRVLDSDGHEVPLPTAPNAGDAVRAITAALAG